MSASDDRGGLIFTDNGPTMPEASEVRIKLAPWFVSAWGLNLYLASSTPQGQFLDSETAIVFDKNNKLAFLSEMFDPETSEGRWQAGLCKIYFISPKGNIPTQVQVKCIGLSGTVVPLNALVEDTSGIQYKASANYLIGLTGFVIGTFECTTPGPVVCLAGTINKIVTSTPNWDAVTNDTNGVIGAFAENRWAIEHRRYNSVAKNAHGNVSAVYGAIANLDKVVSVKIEENYGDLPKIMSGVLVDPHSLYISVFGGDTNDIAWTIYRRKDAGCGLMGNTEVLIFIPTRNSITTEEKTIIFNRPNTARCAVRVNISANDDVVGNIDDLIKTAVIENWNGQHETPRVEIGDVILASRFYCDINRIDDPNFALISVKLARVSDLPDAKLVWENAIGSTLEEFPTISEDDIYIIRGEDTLNGDESSMLRYNENIAGITPKSVFTPPDKSRMLDYNEMAESIELENPVEDGD